jgi:hypothetical protein
LVGKEIIAFTPCVADHAQGAGPALLQADFRAGWWCWTPEDVQILGNVVDPWCGQPNGSDAIRYFLMRERMPFGSTGI